MDWTMPVSPESSVADDEAAAPAAASDNESRLKALKLRTNHLGVPHKVAKPKIRYQSTFTVVWDSGTTESHKRDDDVRIWRLLQDTRAVIDGSVRGVRRLFDMLKGVAPSFEGALLTNSAFKLGMIMNGVKDEVLVQRLFDEFAEGEDEEAGTPQRIDLRHFVRQFVSINREPLEERLDLLFDIWDLDDNGSLKFAELAEHVVHDLPVYKRDRAIATFTRVWTHLRNFASRENEGYVNPLVAAEVTKVNLIEACREMPIVVHFFEEFIMRHPPKADESSLWTEASRQRLMKMRMMKLDAEVRLEVRNEGRPKTTPAPAQHNVGHSKIDPRLLGGGSLIQARGGGGRAHRLDVKARGKQELTFDDDAPGDVNARIERKEKEARGNGSKDAMDNVKSANAAALSLIHPKRFNAPLPDDPGRPRPVFTNARAANRKYHSFIASSAHVPNPLPKPLAPAATATGMDRNISNKAPKLSGSHSEPAIPNAAVGARGGRGRRGAPSAQQTVRFAMGAG